MQARMTGWMAGLTCALALTAIALAQSGPLPEKPIALPLLEPGFVSSDGLIRFEDLGPMSAAMRRATTLLREGKHREALVAFRKLQDAAPLDARAFRGETHAAWRLWARGNQSAAMKETIARFEDLLAHGPREPRGQAVLHYALGDALETYRAGPGMIYSGWKTPALGPEPRRHLEEALRLDPGLLAAHLALAAYHEFPSQHDGTAARRQYEAALRLRPDLAPRIRLLHARTWRRAGYVKPEEYRRLLRQGMRVREDWMCMPGKAIAECKAIVRDFPDFALAYEEIASNYRWPTGNEEAYRRYRALAAAARERAGGSGP